MLTRLGSEQHSGRQHVGSVLIDEGAIHCEVEGSGSAPLLLVNSLGTSLGMWDDQIPALTEGYRIIRYDLRGHGCSSPTQRRECAIADLAIDALAVLDSAGVGVADWCGLSLGGMIAMWVAIHQPQRVARLILCNTAAHLPPAELWQARIEAVRRDGMHLVSATVIERWFTPSFRAAAPERVKRIAGMLRATEPNSYAAACSAIRDMDQREDVKSIAAPTLIIGGSKDPATPLAFAQELHLSIAGSELKVLDAAHLSNVERRSEFSQVVRGFLHSDRRP